MNRSITDRIFAEYDSMRSREEVLRNERVRRVHEKFPELEKIRQEITRIGTECALAVAKEPDREDEIRKSLRGRLDELTERRDEILRENGVPSDYDRVRFNCPICRDTGFVGNEKCSCFKAKQTLYSYESSNLSAGMKRSHFSDFDLNYYSAEPGDDGISPRRRAEKSLAEAKKMAEDFDGYEKSLLFYGGTGLGKTFLSGCIANELIGKGYSVLYVRSGKLFSLLESKKFGRHLSQEDEEMISSAAVCDLLVLDDLGAEAPSKFTRSFLYDIIDERILGGKKMVISTNLTLDELSRMYTQRVTSRLFEFFYAMKLTGTDIRRQKMYE